MNQTLPPSNLKEHLLPYVYNNVLDTNTSHKIVYKYNTAKFIGQLFIYSRKDCTKASQPSLLNTNYLNV